MNYKIITKTLAVAAVASVGLTGIVDNAYAAERPRYDEATKTCPSYIPISGKEMVSRYKNGVRDFECVRVVSSGFGEADLKGINLRGSDLSNSILGYSNFAGADLTGVNLENAQLFDTNFLSAQLKGVDFNRANLYGTNFAWAEMKGVKSLDNTGFLGLAFFFNTSGLTDEQKALIRQKHGEGKHFFK